MMYEKLDNETNSTRRQRVSYRLGKQLLRISVYELSSAPLRRFASFRSSFSLCGYNFYFLSCSVYLLPVLVISDSPDSIIDPTISY
jgi:hypothetical protein